MITETRAGGVDWPASLVELYRTERTKLTRTAYLICCSSAHAEDAVHDALVRVAPRWDGLEQGRAYLYRAVVNAARDVVRRSQRTFKAGVTVTDKGDLGPESLALRDALRQLPERQRVAIVLRYFADWTDDEIARAINARPATVRSLLHRGVGRLREEWKR